MGGPAFLIGGRPMNIGGNLLFLNGGGPSFSQASGKSWRAETKERTEEIHSCIRVGMAICYCSYENK